MARVYNFNPGPSTLPLPALEKAKEDLIDYQGTGMSIMETSHRAPEYDKIHNDAQALMRELMNIPDNYHILFLGGGASTQFAMIPMNFIPENGSADYVITGSWAKKALKEANIIAKGNITATSEPDKFTHIPTQEELQLDPNAAYVHITTNNTIAGTQYQTFPDVKDKPLLADMSSDILSKKIDVSKFSLIYAGAQKNLGPAGVTVVIIDDNFAAGAREDIPTMLSYGTHIEKNSLFNTPPVFPIYMVNLVLEWVKAQGGVDKIESINKQKADMVYQTIDESDGYYRCPVRKDSRSWMNAVMRLPNEELEKNFIAKAKKEGLHGLKGHRSVGGIRISMYNAMPLEGVEKLTDFMKNFKQEN
jgi:phosphoserine aminotransferase